MGEGSRGETTDGYEPFTGTNARYGEKRLTLKDKQRMRQGKQILVYTVGTQDGAKVLYSRKYCGTLDTLLEEIKRRKGGKVSVAHLYKWPSGERVTCMADVEEEGQLVFVCSPKPERFKSVKDGGLAYHGMDYAGRESGGDRSSRDTMRSQKQSPSSVRSKGSLRNSGSNAPPIWITVTSNTHRKSSNKLTVNVNRPFESLLDDITKMLQMENPPCIAIHPVKYPKEKIDSMSSFRKMWTRTKADEFYAVGMEREVLSQSPRGLSPNRKSQRSKPNGYNNNTAMNNENDRQGGYDRQVGYGSRQVGHGQQNGYDRNGYDSQGGGGGYDRNEYERQNGYDRQNDYDYQDSAGRYYRRQQDVGDNRSRPDGHDEGPMYSPRNDRSPPRRRESPGKRGGDKTYRGQDDSPERWDNRGRQDYRRDEQDNRQYNGQDDKRYNGHDKRYDYTDRDGRGRGRDDSQDRGRQDTYRGGKNDYRDRQETTRDDRGRPNKARDDSRDQKRGRDVSDDRGHDRGRSNSKSDRTRDDSRDRGRNDRDHRDASRDRHDTRRGSDNRRESRNFDDDRRRDSRDHGANDRGRDGDDDSSRGVSPTDSEMGNRKNSIDNVERLGRDDSVLL